jgi:uncharacterized protein RhaS with RHS repeats
VAPWPSSEPGLDSQHLVNRYYDPSTDQFLSVDPDVADTGQPYAFTGDDPLNATDPLGLMVPSKSDLLWNARYGCGDGRKRKCVGLAHHVVHVADAVRHFVAAHKKQIAEVAVTAAAVAAIATCTAATAGVCAAVATVSVGAAEVSVPVGALAVGAGVGATESVAKHAIAGGDQSFGAYAREAGIGALEGAGEEGFEEFTPLGGESGAHTMPQNFMQTLGSFWSS